MSSKNSSLKLANSERLLMVEDSYDFYQLADGMLKSHYHLDYAPDAFTALQMINRRNYILILCDVVMPLINGLSLLSEFNKKNIKIPFLFISGHANDKVLREALHLGAYNFIEKPIEKSDLLKKISEAIMLHEEMVVSNIDNQDKAYIYNRLKLHYYDVDRILRLIEQVQLPVSQVFVELEKKDRLGRCLFDDLVLTKNVKVAS